MSDDDKPRQTRQLNQRAGFGGQPGPRTQEHTPPIVVPDRDEFYRDNFGNKHPGIDQPARFIRNRKNTPRLKSDNDLPYDALTLLATVLYQELSPADQAEAIPAQMARPEQMKQSSLDESFAARTKALDAATRKELIGSINAYQSAHRQMHGLNITDPEISRLLRGKEPLTHETAAQLSDAIDQSTHRAVDIKTRVAASLPRLPVQDMKETRGFNGFDLSGPSSPKENAPLLPGMHRTHTPAQPADAAESIIAERKLNQEDAARLRQAISDFNQETGGRVNLKAILGVVGQKDNVADMTEALKKFAGDINALWSPANNTSAHGLPAHTPGRPADTPAHRGSRGQRFP